jgi:hypothetical protein
MATKLPIQLHHRPRYIQHSLQQLTLATCCGVSIPAQTRHTHNRTGTACAFFRTVSCDNPDDENVQPFTHPEVSSNSGELHTQCGT